MCWFLLYNSGSLSYMCVCVCVYIYTPLPLELSFPFPSHPRRLSQSSFILVISLIHASVGPPSGTNGKEPACQCRRHKRLGFNPWVWKIPWSRKCNHSSILAWRIWQIEKSGGLQSMGLRCNPSWLHDFTSWLKWLSTWKCVYVSATFSIYPQSF